MFTKVRLLTLVALFTLGAVVVGCSKEAPPAAPASDVPGPPALGAADGATDASAAPEIEAAFAALSEADRAAAVAQKTCPVSDQALGEMGTPIKVTVNGRDVFLCCDGCREGLLADPDKYLAKLNAK